MTLEERIEALEKKVVELEKQEQPQTISLQIDGDEFARVSIKAINECQRKSGKILLLV